MITLIKNMVWVFCQQRTLIVSVSLNLRRGRGVMTVTVNNHGLSPVLAINAVKAAKRIQILDIFQPFFGQAFAHII